MEKEIKIGNNTVVFNIPDLPKNVMLAEPMKDTSIRKNLMEWAKIINTTPKDTWTELPFFPGYKFLNLRPKNQQKSTDLSVDMTFDSIYDKIEHI